MRWNAAQGSLSVAGLLREAVGLLEGLLLVWLNESTPQGSVSYTYDAAGRRLNLTVGGQPAVTYSYDNANRLAQMTQGSSSVQYSYDTANRRTSVTLPNGVVEAYAYDGASRISGINYSLGSVPLGNLTYTYDAAGRRTSLGGSLAQTNLPQAISSAGYNANNQLLQWGMTALTYDLNGNMTSDGANTYSWNARNQLGALGSTVFAYDALGRRTRNANGTTFLYDGVNVIQELSGSTVTANLLIGLGLDEIFGRTDSAGARSFLTDTLGSTIALTDSSGVVQTRYTYEPFGKSTASGQLSTNSLQYTGRENDGTPVYDYRARYYNPTMQRFISEDPMGFRGGLQLYQYALGDPVNNEDPLGLATVQAGASGSITFFGPAGLSFSFGIAWDDRGNFGVFDALGPAVGVGADVSIGVGAALSSGHHLCDLGGPFANYQVAGGEGAGGTVDIFAGQSSNGPVTGFGFTVGVGLGGAFGTSITNTHVFPLDPRKSCR